jgi:hypothetical protein
MIFNPYTEMIKNISAKIREIGIRQLKFCFVSLFYLYLSCKISLLFN